MISLTNPQHFMQNTIHKLFYDLEDLLSLYLCQRRIMGEIGVLYSKLSVAVQTLKLGIMNACVIKSIDTVEVI